MRVLRGHKGSVVAASALLALGAAVPGLTVVLLERAIAAALNPGGSGRLAGLALAFVGTALMGAVIGVARTALTKSLALRIASDLRRSVHDRWLRLLPPDRAPLGARLSTLGAEVDEVQYGVSALVTALRNPLAVLGLAATGAFLAPGLAPWALLLVPAVWWPSRWGGRRVHARASAARDARAALLEVTREQIGAVPTIRDFAAEDGEATRFANADDADRRARVALETDRALPGAAVQVGVAAAIGLLLWAGGRQIAAGTLEPSAFVGFAVALGLMNRPLQGLSEVWTLWRRAQAGLARVEEALAEVPEVTPPAVPRSMPSGSLGVAWEGVGRAFDGRTVLDGVHLAAHPGEWLLLVGPTGAGKSTLAALVGRHLDPDGGVVRVGGVDVRAIDPRALRRRVAVVRQEPVLFARTIAENLRLGRPDAPLADLRSAARRAGIGGLVEERGWDSAIDPRALSGGERQRLALARALVIDAPIWVLDEPTSQIDGETTRVVLDAVAARPAGTTVVMVAHDLTAAPFADRVAVLDGGRVVEEGTHAALLARRGRYAALWDAAAGIRAVPRQAS